MSKVTYVTVNVTFELHDVDGVETPEQAADLINHCIAEEPEFLGELSAENVVSMYTVHSTIPPNTEE